MNNKTAPTRINSYQVAWQQRFNELCHAVFYKNEIGAELLKHLELMHFRSPVAIPGKDVSWAYFQEGKNELIRSFTVGIQSYLNQEKKSKKDKIK